MDKEQVSKRLYVGGLGHTVSRAELEERFGKFGRVLDAEIITRKDDEGNPMKTFAYVSVNILDADLRKCMSILNKTKWKGGTLQIELAKESFLHRLATEREEAKLQKEKPQRNNQTCLLESLKKTGVVDFHMKAVPGTEVPEHKKWVVGKFGRVLPVLHLRNQQKNKIVKYDPSKYCHNLRKLEPDLAQAAPVSELTWHLEGGDASASRKRPAEFPGMKKLWKKLRQLGSEALNGAAVLSSGGQAHPNHPSSAQLGQRAKPRASDKSKLPPSRSLEGETPGRGLLAHQSNVNGVAAQSGSDSEVDSEEEIRAMVKKEKEKQQAGNVESESDPLEVVGGDFELKYNSHWSLCNPDAMKKPIKASYKETMERDNGYDSADTDEIRYDPTREDHAVFERKPSAAEKESKVKGKKKKEESEKPPQVSEKIYYDIAADLKDLFGSSKNTSEKKEEIPWDKGDAEDSASPDHLGPTSGNDAAQEPSGFKFSFFGDTEKSGVKEEPYILETIKPVKVTWQEDPRFQDSSSEGDEEPEASEVEKDQEMFISLPHRESTRFFFFSRREGPKLFCRSVDLSEEKDGWEDRRRLLLEECRKKHKDAKRKVKAKQ
ncbi:PREDICTED: nucleolar protein 8 [Lepidothrix coronata]|uniref:Nucleolar protein 8 n=1 Tax=Lepidothrix coronata TaxID=321398 RepID=A0A6J0HLB4_9PASS|nr:PREDICTED: nucleolar protein 8 [Lepidothrix coronata]